MVRGVILEPLLAGVRRRTGEGFPGVDKHRRAKNESVGEGEAVGVGVGEPEKV